MAEARIPWQTGFCSVGSHEGLKPKGALTGKPMMTCMRVYRYNNKEAICQCKCHKDLDRMFEMMNMPRFIDQNPEYVPEKATWIMPTLEERVLSSRARDAMPPVIIQSPAPEHVPATMVRAFTPTASGRAGRGELESQVKEACDAWVIAKPDLSCTPPYISSVIAETHDIKPPSVGAISAVFDRWTNLGFALIGRKPVRFVGYTDEGVKHGLEGLKLKAKTQRSSSGHR